MIWKSGLSVIGTWTPRRTAPPRRPGRAAAFGGCPLRGCRPRRATRRARSSSTAALGVARGGEAAGAAIEGDAHAGGGLDLTPARPGTLWPSSGIEPRLTSVRLPCAWPCSVPFACTSPPASQPSRDASQAQNRTPAAPSRAVARRHPVDAAELHAPLGRVEGRGDALAPRCCAARPGRRRRPAGRAHARAPPPGPARRPSRSAPPAPGPAARRRPRGGRAATRHERRDVGHDERVDDRVQLRQVLRPMSSTIRSRVSASSPGLWCRRRRVIEAQASIVVRPARPRTGSSARRRSAPPARAG